MMQIIEAENNADNYKLDSSKTATSQYFEHKTKIHCFCSIHILE